jgi:phosphoserine phosphatase RsbU/P
MRRLARLLLPLFAVILSIPAAGAANPRTVDATNFGQPVDLGPEWLFSPGDNPQWSSPAFDDHAWTVISTHRPLASYGYVNIRFGWYRMHIRLRPGAPLPLVALSGVHGSYEIFANGILIGTHGRMDSNAYRFEPRLIGFPIPAAATHPSGDVVLAIRFAIESTGNDGPGTATPIEDISAVHLLPPSVYQSFADHIAFDDTVNALAQTALALLIAIVAFSLGIALRDHREYIAVSVYLLATAASAGTTALQHVFGSTLGLRMPGDVFLALASVAVIEFIRLVVGQPRRVWILVLEGTIFVCPFANSMAIATASVFLYRIGFFVYFLPQFAANVTLLALLARALMRRNREARFLLPAVLLSGLPAYWSFWDWSMYYLRMTPMLHRLPVWRFGPFRLDLTFVCNCVFLATILLFLVLRTLRIARHNAQVGAELEAARATQQLLLARSAESTPGFHVDTIYHPASKVGGDFFAVQTLEEGALLIVVGDVSGKGIRAAMTVSEILGALRGCTERRPSQVLNYLNNVLQGHTNGFVTCCAARITTSGALTLSNAGHLSPYRKGEEVPLESGLPLGITGHAEYSENTIQLAPGDRLTFLSDGVVEAQSPTGELFGFDRTAAISTQSAEAIAAAAQAFGQEDDITVLTLTFAPAEVLLA